MNSRIRTPFYIFFLNPVYVAARSLRSLRSNNDDSPKTCIELILCKKVVYDFDPVNNISKVSCLKVLELLYRVITDLMHILRISCRRLTSVFVIRCLRIEGYQQPEVDYVFRSIVLSK